MEDGGKDVVARLIANLQGNHRLNVSLAVNSCPSRSAVHRIGYMS